MRECSEREENVGGTSDFDVREQSVRNYLLHTTMSAFPALPTREATFTEAVTGGQRPAGEVGRAERTRRARRQWGRRPGWNGIGVDPRVAPVAAASRVSRRQILGHVLGYSQQIGFSTKLVFSLTVSLQSPFTVPIQPHSTADCLVRNEYECLFYTVRIKVFVRPSEVQYTVAFGSSTNTILP